MPEPRPLEASCRLIEPVILELERRGVDIDELSSGLAFPVAHLRDGSRWIDWATVCEMARRVETIVPRDEAYAVGLRTLDTPAYRYVGTALRTFLNVKRAYSWSYRPTGVMSRFYTCLTTDVREVAPRVLEIDVRMKPGYPVCPFFQEVVRGHIAAVSIIMGRGAPTVTCEELPDGTRYTAELPAGPDRGWWLRRLLSLPRTTLSAAEGLLESQGAEQQRLRELEAEVRRRTEVEIRLRTQIRERERAESARADLERQLQQARRLESLGLLAGGVAHDFNNLLVVILGHADLALTRDTEMAADSVAQIIKAAEKATDITRQLLAFGRRQVLQPVALDLAEVVADMNGLLRQLFDESVDFTVHAGSKLGAVRADAAQLEQVLMNLCVNARDAMPEGGQLSIELQEVKIDVDTAKVDTWARPGRFVLLRVSDTGVGIDSENLERIFDPFFSTKSQGANSGLGLSVVIGIVSQHQGFLQVESEVGKGTSIKVYLPISETAAAPVRRVVSESPGEGGDETILLVEDEQQVRELSEEVLVNAGYRVLPVSTGEAAIRLFRERSGEIDLLLLDVVLPGCSGRDVHEAALEIRPGVAALYTSGHSPRGIHTGFMLDEGLELLQKPYGPDALLRRVRSSLDNRPSQPAR
ncbi:MAG: ATP-binding protein [Myxococcota bacterium]|nr:ATP-binding protein [Myxococcota bacterium]